MKVIRAEAPFNNGLAKGETAQGEVYTNLNDSDNEAYMRLEHGFVHLQTGRYFTLQDAGSRGWIHEPDAVLHLGAK